MTNMERLDKAIKKECTRLGIQFIEKKVQVKDKDGNPVKDANGNDIYRTVNTLASITDEARELMEVFNMNTPCWFKGCQALRDQYTAEKETQGCKSCSGAIMRKYMALARPLLQADPDRKIPDLH